MTMVFINNLRFKTWISEYWKENLKKIFHSEVGTVCIAYINCIHQRFQYNIFMCIVKDNLADLGCLCRSKFKYAFWLL